MVTEMRSALMDLGGATSSHSQTITPLYRYAFDLDDLESPTAASSANTAAVAASESIQCLAVSDSVILLRTECAMANQVSQSGDLAQLGTDSDPTSAKLGPATCASPS